MDGVPAISDRINVFFLDSTRSQLGPSSDLGRATSSLWNSDTSLKTFKIEDHHIFNSNFFLTGTYSLVRAGVHLAPVAGDTPVVYGTNDVWRNGFILYNSDRPQDAFRVDGSNFFNHGSLSQELKFGASYRHADVAESTRWPQGFAYLEEPDGTFSRFFVGNSDTTSSNQFTDFYLQHQLRLGSLTTTVGIRVEHDKGTDGPNTRSGNPLVSLVQPVAQPARQTVDEHNVAPRLGVSWSPPVERRLVFSAGYGLYFDQLPLPFTGFSTDVRGKTAPDGSIVVNDANLLLGTFDPVKNLIDSNFSATKMSEVSGGVETAVGRNFILGARYTQRNLQDLPVLRDLVLDGRAPRVATTNDTFLFGNLVGTDPNGAAVSIPVYALKLGVTSYPGGGQLLTNGFAETHYKGASLTFNRRLANHWMLRGTFSFNDWTWDVPASETVLRPFGLTVGAGLDGEAVAPHSAAPDGVGVYINSKYSYNMNGLYQIGNHKPWGVDASFNFSGRQGYPMPFYASQAGRNLQASDVNDYRFPDLDVLDAGLRKTFAWTRLKATAGFDLFNLVNGGTVLQRDLDLRSGSVGAVLQTLAPRIARVGVRIEF